jgi:hypothetical protein
MPLVVQRSLRAKRAEKIDEITSQPSLRLAGERVGQRSVAGVSQSPCKAIIPAKTPMSYNYYKTDFGFTCIFV